MIRAGRVPAIGRASRFGLMALVATLNACSGGGGGSGAGGSAIGGSGNTGSGDGGATVPPPPPQLAEGPQACVAGLAADFACNGVDLARRVPHSAIGGGGGNDIWGWVDSTTGNEYALVGRTNGTAFVDVTDPLAPIYVGDLPTQTVGSTWRDIKVFADHAYIVADGVGAHGMQVVDLTLLRSAIAPETFVPTAVYGGFGSAHNLAINEASGFGYAVGTDTCNEGLHMIDLSVPSSPAFVGCGEFGDTHDAQCVIYSGPDPDYAGREICFDSDSDRVSIVDVSIKATPTLVSSLTYGGLGFVHQGWLTEDHRYFLLGDELDELVFDHATYTHVIDVTDLDQPVYVVPYVGRTRSTDHNLYVSGNRVYAANYTSGLQVLEIIDLVSADLVEVASFDTFPSNDEPGFSGAWSVYPFFPSGTVVVNDRDTGLFVLTIQ